MQIEKKFFDLEEAVNKAAEQNYETDVRRGLECSKWEKLSRDDKDIYLEEALHLLCTVGENYLPEYPDHHHICLSE